MLSYAYVTLKFTLNVKVRDKTKNHTVNQKQAKNKTWIGHKKKVQDDHK